MHRIRAEMRNQASPRLTVPQMRALLFVQRRPDVGLVDLGEHLGASPSTCSVLVEGLVRQGLVDREPDPAERRRVQLRVTPDGAAVVARARTRTRAWLRQTLGTLPDAELGRLVRAMELLDLATSHASPSGGES